MLTTDRLCQMSREGMLVADGSPAAQLGGDKVPLRYVEVESVLRTGSGERADG